MIIQEDGTMTVSLDRRPLLPEPFAPGWRRESFPHVIDQVTDHRTRWVRVTVIEADGRIYTDTIAPRRRATLQEAIPPAPNRVTPAIPTDSSPLLVQMIGDGFVPGEDIAVALVITHAGAGPDGAARAVLDAHQLTASPTREVILLGRISGTLHIGQPA